MRQARRGVFETNSSSTHSMTICTKKEYDRFVANDLMYDTERDKLVPYSSLLLKEKNKYGYYRYRDLANLGNLDDRWPWMETYNHRFTTPGGDEMVAFGTYGYDG